MTTSTELSKVKHAKTRKGKQFLSSREPQIHEGTKHVCFIRGLTASNKVTRLLRDLNQIKKPLGVVLNKKNDIRPFEDPTAIEFMTSKNDCPLFVFTSHNKKRPDNIVFGRTFSGQILDMFEFGVENIRYLTDFKTCKISVGFKPVLMFAGEDFETQHELIRLKNLFLDFFSGHKTDGIRLSGVESVLSFTCSNGRIFVRHYKICLMKTGTRLPRVELQEIGPSFDLIPRRNRVASDDFFQASLKQPYQLNPKKDKNINRNDLGSTFGRIHMERQDFSKLNIKNNLRGIKRRNQGEETGEKRVNSTGMSQMMDQLNQMNPIKKNRRR